jgi:heat shock protein HtpX
VYEQIAKNKRKTALIIAVFVLLLFLVGFAFNFFLKGGWVGLAILSVIVIISSLVSYFNSDKVALRMSHAVPADPVQYARYHNLVEGLCIASGLPKPRLYIVDDEAPNAFATGRNPKHAAVAVTTGLLEKMNRVELEGVLAHELSHIRNYDILVMTLAVTMVGIIVLVSDFFLRMMFWTGGRGGRNNDSGGGGNAFYIVFAVFGWILLLLSPIIAYFMQAAVSRRREYLADVSGVQMTRYPPGLISALKKLEDDQTSVHTSSKATAHLWIEEPLDKESNKGVSKWNSRFATHPPIEDRIRALEAL